MNTVIAASVSALVIIWLAIVIVRFRNKFITATTAVYLSGTLVLTVMTFVMQGLPMIFVVISEVSILSVYLITMWAIMRIVRNIGEIMKEVEQGKVKSIDEEQEGKDDKEGGEQL
ncbi:hypothetical protein SAMN02910456_00967 [Ruminococcaceae bacterium YRB3002]|nr:hypothetical protein SAMN02910456_00967 [Ruminococcaceae bacterium YRB3002]